MKKIYYSDKVRLKIVHKNSIHGPMIMLRMQENHWYGWVITEELDIEVKYYWGYIPGDSHFGGCLRMSYAMGGYCETWPPDIFNLEERAARFAKEYFEKKREQLKTQKVIKKQLNSL